MPAKKSKVPLYHFRSDCNRFADFVTDNWEELYRLNGPPKIKKWTGLAGLQGVATDRPLGDFAGFPGTNSLVALNSRAWDVVRPWFEDAAETLALGEFGGQEYFVLHVLKVVDALDLERAIVRRTPAGKAYGVTQFAFKPSVVDGLHLFKVPEAIGERPLVSDVVRQAVKKAKLTGAICSPIVQ